MKMKVVSPQFRNLVSLQILKVVATNVWRTFACYRQLHALLTGCFLAARNCEWTKPFCVAPLSQRRKIPNRMSFRKVFTFSPSSSMKTSGDKVLESHLVEIVCRDSSPRRSKTLSWRLLEERLSDALHLDSLSKNSKTCLVCLPRFCLTGPSRLRTVVEMSSMKTISAEQSLLQSFHWKRTKSLLAKDHFSEGSEESWFLFFTVRTRTAAFLRLRKVMF